MMVLDRALLAKGAPGVGHQRHLIGIGRTPACTTPLARMLLECRQRMKEVTILCRRCRTAAKAEASTIGTLSGRALALDLARAPPVLLLWSSGGPINQVRDSRAAGRDAYPPVFIVTEVEASGILLCMLVAGGDGLSRCR